MDLDAILNEMQTLTDTAEAENRALSDEEITRYESLEKDLERARKTEELSKRSKAYAAPNLNINPIVNANKETDEEYQRAFNHYLRTGQQNSDLIETRAQGTDVDSAGGFLVPETFQNKIIQKRKAFGGIANAATTVNTSDGRPLLWPTNDDVSDTAAITDEHAQWTTGEDITFGQATLGAYKYTTVGASNNPLRVSIELLQDSAFDVESFIANKFADRIHRKQAEHWATGTGTGQPKGLFTTTSDLTATSITYANVVSLVHKLDPAYRQNAQFVMNDASVASLDALTDSNGRPLLGMSTDGIAGRPSSTLLGYGVIIDQGANVVASGVNYLAFGDISEAYVIRQVKDVTLVVNPYSRANFGEIEYLGYARADGTIQDRNAYVVAKG